MLLVCHSLGEVVGVLVTLVIAEFFHQFGGGVADVQRDGEGAAFAHFGQGLVDAEVAGVTFGGGGQISDALGEIDAGFGEPDEMDRLLYGQSDLQAAGRRCRRLRKRKSPSAGR